MLYQNLFTIVFLKNLLIDNFKYELKKKKEFIHFIFKRTNDVKQLPNKHESYNHSTNNFIL